jgi:hypothetical protein
VKDSQELEKLHAKRRAILQRTSANAIRICVRLCVYL